MRSQINEAFERGDTTEIIRIMGSYFGEHNYSLRHLFRDEQRKVLNQIVEHNHTGIEASYREIYETNNALLNFLSSLRIPIPRPLLAAAEQIINIDVKRAFTTEDIDLDRLERLITEAQRWNVDFDKVGIGHSASLWLITEMEKIGFAPEDAPLFERMSKVLRLLQALSLDLDLWRMQNMYFLLKEGTEYDQMRQSARDGDEEARRWLDSFHDLGDLYMVRIQ
jgi:predicted DNA-binding ribbon-helix-helix protein